MHWFVCSMYTHTIIRSYVSNRAPYEYRTFLLVFTKVIVYCKQIFLSVRVKSISLYQQGSNAKQLHEAEVEEAIEVLVEEELGMNPTFGEGLPCDAMSSS